MLYVTTFCQHGMNKDIDFYKSSSCIPLLFLCDEDMTSSKINIDYRLYLFLCLYDDKTNN
jgi:hypothetical protein